MRPTTPHPAQPGIPMPGTRRLALASGLLLPLILVSCTCGRPPAAAIGTAPTAKASKTADAARPAPSATATAASAAQTQQAARMGEAASLVHAYLGALAAGDRTRADAYWRNGHPPPVADDALLRNLPGLQSVQIRNTAPVALDKAVPTGAVEVPVTLRMVSPQGQVMHYVGRYRLARSLDDAGWQISSASVHARVD